MPDLAFTVGGVHYRASRRMFEERLAEVMPEATKKYSVEIKGQRYPIKQAVAVGLGAPRAGFQTQEAFRVLRRLGFKPIEEAPTI